jgi:hypothetical protein
MREDIRDLLFHPGRFYERKTAEKPDYRIPVLIAAAGWVFSLLIPVAYTAFSQKEGQINLFAVPAIYWLLFNPFIAWILLTLALFGLSRLFSGTGTFMATLCNAGYGMLPLTVAAFIQLVASPLSGPAFSLAVPPVVSTAIFYILNILKLLLILWSGYLWMHAVGKTHAISRVRATAAAGLVTFLYLVWVFALPLFVLLKMTAGG